jgi:GNAT superfamily N-acetyltransferase
VSSPLTLRRATLDDVAAGAAVRASAVPDLIITAEGMLAWLADLPEEARLLLLAAETAGATVGWCTATRNVFGSDHDAGMIDVTVRPEHQGRSIGARLLTEGLGHLDSAGLTTVRTSSVDGPAQRATAARFGFVEAHASSLSSVDPRTVEPLPVPDDVVLRSFGELDDPRPIYELDLETSRDIPGEEGFDGMTLEQWTGRFWRTVLADDEASLAAYVDGELAALTMLRVDRPSGRAQNNLTATRRRHRGRGLARLLKSHSLHLAAQAGATVAVTENDETNASMLAVNRALGYRHSSRHVEWERRTALAAP